MNQTDISIFILLLIIMFLLTAIFKNGIPEGYCHSYKYNMGSSASDEELGYPYGTKTGVRDYVTSCKIPNYLVGVV